jgi:hypothetical protein
MIARDWPMNWSDSTSAGACSASASARPLRGRTQSEIELGASTSRGASPCRPPTAKDRSLCSLLAGMPVDGPPRITSDTTIGTSAATARPMPSVISDRPGPAVAVSEGTPPKEAPMIMLIEASSSSACSSEPPTWAAPAPSTPALGGRRDRVGRDEADAAADRAVAGRFVAADQPAAARRGAARAGSAMLAGGRDALAQRAQVGLQRRRRRFQPAHAPLRAPSAAGRPARR